MTNLLSKSSSLENTLIAMQKSLDDLGCKLSYADEKHPLTNCYSLLVRSDEAPNHIYANGKGTLSDACKASALGEYIERLQTNNFFSDFYLPKRSHYPDQKEFSFEGGYLNEELKTFYNPNNEWVKDDLIDYNSDTHDKIIALPFVEIRSAQVVYFPISLLSNLYVSNGLASGNSPQEAQVQALSEIIERYVKKEIIQNGYALPSYPDELLQTYPLFYENLCALRNHGYVVEVLDASLDGVFPVTAISLINPANATLMVSFGSHPMLEVSLERTFTELLQGREIDELDGFQTPTFDMDVVSDNFNLEAHFIDSNGKMGFEFLSAKKSFDYRAWYYDGSSIEDELNYLKALIEGVGKKIYLREYDYLGFYSCQILVPSLSEVYPIDDMIYNNKNQGKKIRQMVLNTQSFKPQEILEHLEELDDNMKVGKYIGVIFDQPFSIQEFKAQIHLQIGNIDEAYELLYFSDNFIGKIIIELIQMQRDNHDFEQYQEGLTLIYGKRPLQEAQEILKGKRALIDTTLSQEMRNVLGLYDRLESMKKK